MNPCSKWRKIVTMLTICGAVLIGREVNAANAVIPFTAKITDRAGNVIDGQQTLTFRLYTQSSGGSGVWTEVRTNTVIKRGVVSVNLGEQRDLATVDGDDFWIGITVGSDPEMAPRLKLPPFAAAAIGAGLGAPVGSVIAFAGSTVPRGWVICDGAAISKADYPKLYAIIGTTYGTETSTSFTVPDLRGRTVFGAGTGSGLSARQTGDKGGEEAHLLKISEMPSHNHSKQSWRGGYNSGGDWIWAWNAGNGNTGLQYTDNTGGDQPHNTMPPYVVLNYIIRAR